jgi:hypothetical protein
MIAERLIDSLKAKQEAAKQRYARLCESVAAGEAVADEEAVEIIDAAGRTPLQLEAEVKRLRRIAEIEPQIRELERLQQESNQREATFGNKLDELRRIRDDAVEAVAVATAEANARVWERQQRGQEMGTLRQELRGLTTPPPSVDPPADPWQAQGLMTRPDRPVGVQ